MLLRTDPPADHMVINLAPVVEMLGDNSEGRKGQMGYALCLISIASMDAQGLAKPGCPGGIRVCWEDGDITDEDARDILFKL